MTVESPWGPNLGDDQEGIHVDDLGAPEPSPFAEEELAAEDEVAVPPMTDQEAGHLLGEVIGIPFSFAGSAYASRARQLVPTDPDLPPAIQGIWSLGDEEADRIGGRVFAAIPARFREGARGALQRTPLALAAGSIVQAVRFRHRASMQAIAIAAAQAAQEETHGQSFTRPGPQPVPSGDGRAPRAPGGGGDRNAGAVGLGVDPGDDAAKGLGLSGIVQPRAAERRRRRFPG